MAKTTDIRPKITLACTECKDGTTSPRRTGATTRIGLS